jgi:hypothetical protein
MCTLGLPRTRIVVINSTYLIPAVQRQVRVLDFAPIESRAVVNLTPAGREILNMSHNGVGESSHAIEFGQAIYPTTTPDANLDAVNRLSVQKVSVFLDTLTSKKPQTVKLFDWVRQNIAWATSEAVCGFRNPF